MNGINNGSSAAADGTSGVVHEHINGTSNGGFNGTAVNGLSEEPNGNLDATTRHEQNKAGNAHEDSSSQHTGTHQPLLIVASASSEKSLKVRAADVERFVKSRPSSIDAVAHTLGTRRVHLLHRAFCIADSARSPLKFGSFHETSSSAPDVAFVFTGQGAQWAGMGKDLCRWMPSFRKDIQEMDHALKSLDKPAAWSMEGNDWMILSFSFSVPFSIFLLFFFFSFFSLKLTNRLTWTR